MNFYSSEDNFLRSAHRAASLSISSDFLHTIDQVDSGLMLPATARIHTRVTSKRRTEKDPFLRGRGGEYSNVGLGSSLRGEPGLTTLRSQDCWPVWCTPCARNFPMVKSSIVYWISQNLAQSPLMYYNIQYGIRFIKKKIYISV